MVAFYNEKDQAIYDAGDKFVPQTEYLQNDYVPTSGISYAGDGSPVSYANSGIMSGYMTPPPIIYPPIINQGGGDGPVDPGPKDYGYTGPGSTGSVGGFNIDDIGEGTIDDEDDEEEGKIGKMGLAKIAGSTLVGGPFSGAYTAYNEKEKAKQDKIDAINADINAQYGYGTGAASKGDMDSYGVDKDTGNPGNYDQDYDMKDGGRAGYFFGGRVNYKGGGIARLNFANGTPGFYNAKDQAIYDGGDKFIPQTEYLQNDYIPTEGISYEGDGSPVSYANSMGGIMTQAPIIYPPIINQGGGDGGEGPPGPPDDDEEEENAGITSKMDIAKNVLGFMMNPVAFGLTKAYQAYRQKKEDQKVVDDITKNTVPGVRNDPNTVGGSSRDSKSGGSFGTSTNEATGAKGSGTGFSDYS